MSGKVWAGAALAFLAAPSCVRAQQPAVQAENVAGVCSSVGVPAAAVRAQAAAPAVADSGDVDPRQQARRLSAAATQAELLGDEDAAVDLLRRALRADPSNADDRYRLARLLEVKGDTAAAVKDYCRYIALSPGGEDRADAEARLLALAPTPPAPTTTSVPSARAQAQPTTQNGPPSPAQKPSPRLAPPQSVLLSGLLLPGSGQVMTGRTPLGLFIGAGVVGAAVAGVMTKKITIDCLSEPVDGTCPAGDVVRQRVERPLLVPGIAVAAAGAILAAIEAYHFRSRQIEAVAGRQGAQERRATRVLPPSASADASGVDVSVIRIRF